MVKLKNDKLFKVRYLFFVGFNFFLQTFRIILKISLFQVKRGGNKNVTPYIIFASQIRKKVSDDNKGATFGEISKIVGDQVSLMSKIFKRIFCTFSF